MNIRNLNIKDASSAALEALMQDISVELQERMYVLYDDALTHGLYVDELEKKYQQGYADYIRDNGGLAHQELLEEWQSEQDRIQSMCTTGA